ncbi:MAG: hypothetical protein WC897_03930 [Candidatus Gracilibacteria bacterium]
MALHCINFGFIDPFEKKGLSYVEQQNNDALKSQAEKLIKETKGNRGVEAAPETVREFNEKLDKLATENPSKLSVFLYNLEGAFKEYDLVQKLLPKVSKSIGDALKQNFWSKYEDDMLSHEELNDLINARQTVEYRLQLRENSLKPNTSELIKNSLAFVQKKGEDAPVGKDATSLKEDTEYVISLKDPKTGLINRNVQKYLTLGHILTRIGAKTAKVGDKIAHLWKDGNTYDREETEENRQTKRYIPIVEGSEFKIMPDTDTDMSGTYIEPTLRSVETKKGQFDDIQRRGDKYARYDATASTPAVLATAEETATKETDYSSLLTQKASLPPYFKGKYSNEYIREIKQMQNGGEKVYEALDTLAKIATKMGNQTDMEIVWNNIRGFIPIIGTRQVVSFKEIVHAIYGPKTNPEDVIKENGTFTERKAFLNASKNILDNLSGLTPTNVTVKQLVEGKRNLTFEAGSDLDKMSKYTENFFDKDNFGPPVDLAIRRRIIYMLGAKDRPILTKENCLTPLAGGAQTMEGDVISEARAYEKLMESGSKTKYLTALNKYINLGAESVKMLNSGLNVPGQITNLNSEPTEEQTLAIRYGMMVEASMELHLLQEAEEEAAQKVRVISGPGKPQVNFGANAYVDLERDLAVGGYVAVAKEIRDNVSVNASVSASTNGESRLRAGVQKKWDKLGRKDKGSITTGAGVLVNPENGDIGMGAYAEWNRDLEKGRGLFKWFNKNGNIETSVEAGASAYLSGKAEANAGGGLDFDANAKLITKIAEAQKTKKPEIEAICDKTKNNTALSSNPKIREAYANATRYLLNQIVARKVIEGFEVSAIRITDFNVLEGGVATDTRTGKFGASVGPSISFVIGDQTVTMHLNPDTIIEDPDNPIAEVWTSKDADKVDVSVNITDEILWNGDNNAKEVAKKRATETVQKALQEKNDAFKDKMTLKESPDGLFTQIDFKQLDGTVRLFVDRDAKFQLIHDKNATYLNMGLKDNLIVTVNKKNEGYGGANTVEIFLSDTQKSAEKIKAESGMCVTWNQWLNDKTDEHEAITLNKDIKQSNIYSYQDAQRAINEGSLKVRGSTGKSAEALLREEKFENVAMLKEISNASIFAEFTEPEKDIAKNMATELLKEFDYNALATSENSTAINNRIIELYNPAIPSENKILLVRQYAMEQGRRTLVHLPIGWNEKALNEIAGPELTEMYMKYVKDHQSEIESASKDDIRNDLKGTLPDGAEFVISVCNDGKTALLRGYYNREIHGDVLARIKFDKDNPKQTLEALGSNGDDTDLQDKVKAMATVIEGRPWKKLEQNATLEQILNSSIGAIIRTDAKNLYANAPEKANRLLEIAKKPSMTLNEKDKELIEEFKTAVLTLSNVENGIATINGIPVKVKSEVYIGLYEECMNLLMGKHPILNYPQPKQTPVTLQYRSNEKETGLESKVAVRQTVIKAAVIPSIGDRTQGINSNEAGNAESLRGGENGPMDDPGQELPH